MGNIDETVFSYISYRSVVDKKKERNSIERIVLREPSFRANQ